MQQPAASNPPIGKAAVGRPKDKGGKRRNLAPYILMAPTMIYMVALVIYPLLFSLFIAFRRFDPAKGMSALKMTWVGWGNFTKVMADQALWISLGNTVYIGVVALVL